MKTQRNRIAWIAGTRSEILRLGPIYSIIQRELQTRSVPHWFAFMGEQGMQATQALDLHDIVPHEMFELRHPADDCAVRLYGVMRDIDTLVRRHKATHLIFAGCGASSAAAAMVTLARQRRGLWLRPADPARVNEGLGWESGLERMIDAAKPWVETVRMDEGGLGQRGDPGEAKEISDDSEPRDPFIRGLREAAPVVLVSLQRAPWGNDPGYAAIVKSAAAWARAIPAADVVILRSLDARLEGPLRAMKDRPENLLGAAPMPYPEYARLMNRTAAVCTDSCNVAAEAISASIPVVTVGDLRAEDSSGGDSISGADSDSATGGARIAARIGDLGSETFLNYIRDAVAAWPVDTEAGPAGAARPIRSIWRTSDALLHRVRSFIDS